MKKVILIFVLGFCCTFEILAQYSIVFLNKKNDAVELPKDKLDELMKGHLANIERLAKENKILVAGPFDGGGGIFILSTTSKKEAEQWLSTDPGIQANRWNVEILPFKPTIGKICKVKEPYEMVSYIFLRFDAIVSKFTASTYPEIMKKHQEHIDLMARGGNVIVAGDFGVNEGGILIIKGELQQEVIEMDPGVQEMLLEVVQKKLWIAKGSFCED